EEKTLLFDLEITKSKRKRRKNKNWKNQPLEIAMGDQEGNRDRTLSEYGNPSLAETRPSIVSLVVAAN
ncbi:hypothetical protein Dimus_029239, partial [Dionaea muscipula]